MAKITINFADAGRTMRGRIGEAIGRLEQLQHDLPELGVPEQDLEFGTASGELAEALNHLAAAESILREQMSRNRASFMEGGESKA